LNFKTDLFSLSESSSVSESTMIAFLDFFLLEVAFAFYLCFTGIVFDFLICILA